MAYKRSRQAFEADLQKQSSPFVLYGTPLPPLDENIRDDGSFVPVWKQEVTDERGRKRLHGAFTGGFSAGYFNTVGSKEGWTPSSFVSSRQNRANRAQNVPQQKPEDFMDEEDFREAEESRTLNTSSDFSGFGTEHDAMRKTAAIDIFRPVDETIGSKLLKRMGWREGQGIGPRVRRAAKLGEEGEDDDEPAQTHLFAPDDVKLVSFVRKTDHKGLGYQGELQDQKETASQYITTKHPRPGPSVEISDEDGTAPLFGPTKKPAPARKRTGFGVGVLNDDDSDEEDPYSMGPKISYHKVIAGEKTSKSKSKSSGSAANPFVKTKPTFVSKKLATLKGVLRKCHDGRLPPDGFVLADELDSMSSMTINDEKYRPPEVPEGWKSSISPSTEADTTSTFVATAVASKSSNLTAKSRASLLGESQLPGKSVFDFLTPATRDRLVAASGRQNLPAAGSEPPPSGYEPSKSVTEDLQTMVPQLERDTALQALNRAVGGWMPYAEDENKRLRYRTYLEIQAGLRSSDELPPRAENMRRDDWVLEMKEFARAAEVFKPISGLMANRFTSSSTLSQGQDGKSGDTAGSSLLTKPKTKPEDPAESAAKLGMFGPMTRSTINFCPTRLLCKRFNVPMPTHAASKEGRDRSSTTSPAGEPGPAATQFRPFTSAGFQHDEGSEVNKRQAPALFNQPSTPAMVGNEPAALDPDKNEALEKQRPGQAVFKAIFGSDDEDDE
ncbi:uncharacterized protein Z519_08150 [Cladophialophora bantiana CBS 173.52]|uniref:G-patch domain-containing protein n=1 Tax=Cladophialophora bantiana (strain ATCC 10958 / CBS 173.52 / CDC B-1940 / NIH 8579) TaxID=1442370 RepID=A0A0D2I2W9_CLAB1|nr:uncharacterized protein Z519_08150 [Cladophialophora bantiana CBS 173.52]KIW91254.1 hypothetical protein Z519_08150 [Cladophialophora bantiana CBS 173.52]